MGDHDNKALIKEIRGRAIVLVVTLGIADIVFLVFMLAKPDNMIAVAVLAFLSILASTGVILGVLAIINPIRYKKMFRNLSNDYERPLRHNMTASDIQKASDIILDSRLFGRKIPVEETDAPISYVNKCVFCFNNMNDAMIGRLCRMAIQYYNDFKEASGDSESNMPDEINGREILEWIYPQRIIIDDNAKDSDDIDFIVDCNCAWEPEHGLEIIVACNQVVHVGAYDGDLEYWKDEYIRNSAD